MDLDQTFPQAAQPADIKIPLKPHQLVSLHRMSLLDNQCKLVKENEVIHANLGILADFPGYGKTLTLLSLISMNKELTNEAFVLSKSYNVLNHGVVITLNDSSTYNNSTLIVVPDNLLQHWTNQITKFTKLTLTIVRGNSILDKIENIDKDIILCAASKYNQFVEKFADIKWNRVVFDEADSIYIPSTHRVKTRFLWCITATFMALSRRSNRGFLRDIFHSNWKNVMEEYYKHLVIKCSDDFVKLSFEIPPPDIKIVQCRTSGTIYAIHKYIKPQVLEMISANNINGAILSLGGNVSTDKNIINLITRNIRNKIVKIENKIQNLNDLELELADKNKKEKVLKEQLKVLKTREKEIIENIKNSSEHECPICYENLNSPVISECEHIFCGKCLLGWLKNNTSCPLCRSRIDLTKLNSISVKNIKGPKIPTKLEMCLKIVTGQGKYLIFSSYDESFREIETKLKELKISFGTLTTNLKTEKTLTQYRSGEISVILLNTKFNGAGIDLHETTDLIIFHELPAHLEKQIVARGQRPGRKEKMNIWKLAYDYEYIQKM